jgi:biopolymer transport protein TolR
MKRRRLRGEIQGDINVTPLVDVVLVLLIIFMVVTPLIAEGMPVELPRTEHHDRKAVDGRDLIVSVTRESQVYLDSNPVALADLTRLIEEARRLSAGKGVFVRGDAGASYGTLRQVMEAVHRAHVPDVVLGTAARQER